MSKKLKSKELIAAIKNIKKELGSKRLNELFTTHGLSSPIVVIGKESLRTKRLINWIVDSVFTENKENISKFFGTEITNKAKVEEIKSGLSNLSLFCTEQILIIYEVEKIKAAFAKPILEEILKNQKDTIVILAAESMNKKSALLNGLEKKACIAEIGELNNIELIRWIEQEAKRAGAKAIDKDAATTLAKNYGNELATLANEIAKLALLTDKENSISKSLVKEICLKSPEHNSFELVSQIAQKNQPLAAKLTSDLLRQGLHPLQLSSFLSRCFRTLIANKYNKSTCKELSNYWFTNKLNSVKNKFSDEDLDNSIEELKKLDARLKGIEMNGIPDKLCIALSVQKLARRSW